MFQPLQDTLSTFFSYIPQLIGAIVILIVSYIVADGIAPRQRCRSMIVGWTTNSSRGSTRQPSSSPMP